MERCRGGEEKRNSKGIMYVRLCSCGQEREKRSLFWAVGGCGGGGNRICLLAHYSVAALALFLPIGESHMNSNGSTSAGSLKPRGGGRGGNRRKKNLASKNEGNFLSGKNRYQPRRFAATVGLRRRFAVLSLSFLLSAQKE